MKEKDALKFFHAYIDEMISLGGENFPRSISTRLGGNLAEVYKSRGITNLEGALSKMYEVLGAEPKIETNFICCPPDPHPEEYFCAWEFILKDK
ncbi:unnamed protein product [marine sediment metagenome]|uniref:Uncharacterized protein n=1 Tax=marine sediment metagenome TaxID=412755 RepID=X1DZE4_9ZZZZ